MNLRIQPQNPNFKTDLGFQFNNFLAFVSSNVNVLQIFSSLSEVSGMFIKLESPKIAIILAMK